jgi:AcrR family transcriptional regulator
MGGGIKLNGLDPKAARKEAVKDMKRELIMDAAVKTIARDGYGNVRLDDIAEAAGFSKAAIYHYFPDKEALFVHIVIREQRADYDRYMEIMSRNLPFLETLREFAVTSCAKFCKGDGITPTPSMLSNFIVSITKHEDLLNVSMLCMQEQINLLRRFIAKAKKEGVLTIPVDDETVCAFIISFFQTIMMQNTYGEWNGKADLFDINSAIDNLFTFLGPWINDANPPKAG